MQRYTTVHSGKLRNMASVYLLQEQEVLLLYRQGHSIVHDLWIGSAGGHFEEGELNDAKACVLREMQEELSISADQIRDLQLRYVTLRNADDEIRQNYYFFATLDPSAPRELVSTEGITKWFHLTDTAELPMPFTAKYVLAHYVSTGQHTQALYGGIGNDSGVTFIEL